jgi:DNA mismatch repair protein MutS
MARAMTPMKEQYYNIKREYTNCLLLFRLGDFYEMFDEDAKTAAKELDLALTTRDRGRPVEEQTPMCGVPYHSAEAYIGRLLQKGYRVAICDQLEDPAEAKGLVKRGVIRVITPGTAMENSFLDESRANYIASVFMDAGGTGAVAFCDVSTGEFCVASFQDDAKKHIMNELGRFAPKEAVLSAGAAAQEELVQFLTERLECLWDVGEDRFDPIRGARLVCRQFGTDDLDRLGLGDDGAAVSAAGSLLDYLVETQKCDLTHINQLDTFSGRRYMELDYTTRRNLELTENLRLGERRGSLLWVLDKTRSPMGSRELRKWIERPLLSPITIKRRQAAVQELFEDSVRRGELRNLLKDIGDMIRLISRIAYGSANGRDLIALRNYLRRLPPIAGLLKNARSAILDEMSLMDVLQDVEFTITRAIADDPAISLRDGGILREGYSEEVDRLRKIEKNGSDMIRQMEQAERDRTGIKKLKIGYNKVFGYYIDIPKSAGETAVPDNYIRKQTLVSNERYISPELKQLEEELLTAHDKCRVLEYRYFEETRQKVAAETERMQKTAAQVAALDALCSLAEVAVQNQYVCPEVDMGSSIHIVEGRHPVVEATQRDSLFVPNDTFLNDGEDRVAIITGPNMAGKSTYMRQTALIVLMAQIGSFVPAKSASIGIVDRVFTRIGASDDLASGQSTFMVEMTEMADILKYATSSSLLILDEIGRGTSTFDGMAIARAVLEYCADRKKLGAKTMFATHYRELTDLEGELEGVKNYNITARKQGGNLIFLRKIVRGAADDSYGIEVADLAGVPDGIIAKAKTYLKELESGAVPAPAPRRAPAADAGQITLADMGGEEALRKLRNLDINTLTPLEAMNALYEMKRALEGKD